MLVVYEALSHQNHAREQNVSRHDVVGDEQQGHSEGPHSAWTSGSGHLALPRTASNHRRVFPPLHASRWHAHLDQLARNMVAGLS